MKRYLIIQKKYWLIPLLYLLVILGCYYMPVSDRQSDTYYFEALQMVRFYARQHLLASLVPAFLLAGVITAFINRQSVIRYLGPMAPKVVAYLMASAAGSVIAVCSCTVLPMFAGIYRMGAGIGPATAFLYAGPAVNILAILLTARVLGLELGLARALGAVIFSIVIGLIMQMLFGRKEPEAERAPVDIPDETNTRSFWKVLLLLLGMAGVLVFANWSLTGNLRVGFVCCPEGSTIIYREGEIVGETDKTITILDDKGQETVFNKALLTGVTPLSRGRIYNILFLVRYEITIIFILLTAAMLIKWYRKSELLDALGSAWQLARQILPLLLIGAFIAGGLFGRPGHHGLVPSAWVEWAVGGNSVRANFCASLAGSLMYFATLTEVPVIQGLIGAGMGRGPTLALLLAGPALSLPSMLVIKSVIGTRKTLVFILLVVVMAAVSGMIFGAFFPE